MTGKEIQKAVNEILINAAKIESIKLWIPNSASCIEVCEIKDLLDNPNPTHIQIIVDEASPDAYELRTYISDQMMTKHGIQCVVITEW